MPDFSSAFLKRPTTGVSGPSMFPMTSMLLFGTKLRMTPGSTTSFAE